MCYSQSIYGRSLVNILVAGSFPQEKSTQKHASKAPTASNLKRESKGSKPQSDKQMGVGKNPMLPDKEAKALSHAPHKIPLIGKCASTRNSVT